MLEGEAVVITQLGNWLDQLLMVIFQQLHYMLEQVKALVSEAHIEKYMTLATNQL